MKEQYNWQHPDWPNFKYDKLAVAKLASRFLDSYRSLSRDVTSLPIETSESLRLEQLVDEATSTSAIEGIQTKRDSLRSSIASKLYIPGYNAKQDAHSDAIANIVTGIRELRHNGIDHPTLWRLQHDLIKSQIGNAGKEIQYGYRTYEDDMVIADSKYCLTGKGEVFFVAPPSSSILRMMGQFSQQFNATHPEHIKNQEESFARIAISHIWFESIHPFEGGNGRIGRAISDLALCQFLGQDAIIGVSKQMSANNNEYYSQLQKASKCTVDISEWVEWFGSSLISATINAQKNVALAKLQSRWWRDNEHLGLNKRQEKIIRKLFQFGAQGMEGGLTARKYSGVTRASKATATRDLAQLEKLGVIAKSTSGGRSTSYSLTVFNRQSKQNQQ